MVVKVGLVYNGSRVMRHDGMIFGDRVGGCVREMCIASALVDYFMRCV